MNIASKPEDENTHGEGPHLAHQPVQPASAQLIAIGGAIGTGLSVRSGKTDRLPARPSCWSTQLSVSMLFCQQPWCALGKPPHQDIEYRFFAPGIFAGDFIS